MIGSLPRRLQPEWLDLLPANDPRVVRLRRDLRLINWLMGNHRWLLRQLKTQLTHARGGVCELGAGDGSLLARIHGRWPSLPLTGLDRAPRPGKLEPAIAWRSGDLLYGDDPLPGAVLIGNLVLHHFTREQLEALGVRMQGCRVILLCESHRDPDVVRRSRWLNPLLGELTRHDMPISLEAGFLPGELPKWLGLAGAGWHVKEESNIFGSHRLLAVRNG